MTSVLLMTRVCRDTNSVGEKVENGWLILHCIQDERKLKPALIEFLNNWVLSFHNVHHFVEY